jgi:hypothetical protein
MVIVWGIRELTKPEMLGLHFQRSIRSKIRTRWLAATRQFSNLKGTMSYPNYATTTAGFPAPSSGVGVPAVVVLSGTGVSQVVNRNADGAGATGGAYGSIVAEQMRGPEYVMPLAKGATAAITATLVDCRGNSVAAVNTGTGFSWNAAPLSQASFRPLLPNEAWLPNRVAPNVPAGQTGPGAGNGLVWNSKVVTVDINGVVTANDIGFGIVEVRYPKSSASSVNDFIYALLFVTVTTVGTDVE